MRGFQNDHFGGMKQTNKQTKPTLLSVSTNWNLFIRYHIKSAAYKVPVKKHTNENIYCILKKREKHSLQQSRKMKQKKKNGWPQEVYNHVITVTFFSSQIKPYLSWKGRKKKTQKKLQGSSLIKERAQAQQNWYWISSIHKRMMHVSFIWVL